jgi:5-methylcytosine-specific restriction endonuclease McrA
MFIKNGIPWNKGLSKDTDDGTLTCYLCIKPIEFGDDCLEHKTPLSRGGNNERKNLDIAHISCNSRKRHRTVEEYNEYMKGK